jgi:hypothetical protein
MLALEPWKENTVYPGRHWLLYSDTRAHHLVATVHAPETYTNGLYLWRVSRMVTHSDAGPGDDVGYSETLEQAKVDAVAFLRQCEAEWELIKPRVQLKMF